MESRRVLCLVRVSACLEVQAHNGCEDQYYPRRHDSHLESVQPESSFLEYFKQSLIYTCEYCTDPACCTIFDDAAFSRRTNVEHGPHQMEGGSANAELSYPLALFEDLQDLPPVTVMLGLAASFHDRFVPSTPFLSKVSTLAPDQRNVPFYLLLSKALMGAVASEDLHLQLPTDTLWRACTSLVTGTVEVDNSLGRVITWLSAVRLVSIMRLSKMTSTQYL